MAPARERSGLDHSRWRMPLTLVVSICVICGGAIAAPVDICYACAADTIIASRTKEERRSAEESGISTLPVLTVRDFSALERFARLRLRPDDPAARDLLAKLDRARVVPTGALAADVVALGTRIIFSVNNGPPGT